MVSSISPWRVPGSDPGFVRSAASLHRPAFLGKSQAPTPVRPVGDVVHFGSTGPEHWPDGAHLVGNKARFKVWAPHSHRVKLLIIPPPGQDGKPSLEDRIRSAQVTPMQPSPDGKFFSLEKPDLQPGSLYMFRLYNRDGSISKPLPDLFSRFQPEDVHGPSELVASKPYVWQATQWKTPTDRRTFSVYHMHVGTFTPEGTLASAVDKLDYIKDLGKKFVKIMPIQEFPGKWNWGYDMVQYFATENAYGRPEDFKQFVDEAHKRGLGVIQDVVFNHIGPEGNYFKAYDPDYIDPIPSQWGDRFNWENPQAMKYVLSNVEMWLKEFKVDGFRFDMASRIPDHAMRQITQHIRSIKPDAVLIAEDERHSDHVTTPLESVYPDGKKHGLGFDFKWNFDFHHRVKGLTTGKSHMDAPTDPWSLSWILEDGFPGGWKKMGQLGSAVNSYEGHDEAGNHDGFRTNMKLADNRFIVGSMLKYLVPGLPWSFMGEEMASPSKFYFFVNYSDPACIKGVREGRKYAPQPDCMRPENFTDSKLQWEHANPRLIELNKAILKLRETMPALWQGGRDEMQVDRSYLDSGVLVIRRVGKENPEDKAIIVLNLSDYHYNHNYQLRFADIAESRQYKSINGAPSAEITLKKHFPGQKAEDWAGPWEEVLNTEDIRYGGSGWTNGGQQFTGGDDISLPAWSLSIFRQAAPKA